VVVAIVELILNRRWWHLLDALLPPLWFLGQVRAIIGMNAC
jgi:hypothetical protein